MNTLQVLELAGFGIAVIGLITIIFSLRNTFKVLDEHRGVLEEANKISRESLLAAREANQIAKDAILKNQEAFDQQFRLALYPHLECRIEHQAASWHVKLSNPGSTPAYNVNVFVISVYENQETPLPGFVQTYVRTEVRENWLKDRSLDQDRPDEFSYSIVHVRSYRCFPSSREVLYNLNLPSPPTSMYVVLQYENTRADNYLYLYLFTRTDHSDDRSEPTYRLVYRNPQAMTTSSKIEMIEKDGRYYLLPEGPYVIDTLSDQTRTLIKRGLDSDEIVDPDQVRNVPSFLVEPALLGSLRYSMPSRYLKREYAVSIEREIWTDVLEENGIKAGR